MDGLRVLNDHFRTDPFQVFILIQHGSWMEAKNGGGFHSDDNVLVMELLVISQDIFLDFIGTDQVVGKCLFLQARILAVKEAYIQFLGANINTYE